MGTEFTIRYTGTYIHVDVGENYEINAEAMEQFWPELIEAAKHYQCRLVLSEGTISEREMSTIEAYQSATAFPEAIPGIRLACCFYNYPIDEISRFFQTVAHNRGAQVEFFKDKAAALSWLGVGMPGNNNSTA
ncbi:MAG: hypothetical protein SWH61_11430 [Thermodesulfobacteriota bacterium]|nr:hypothetical protein [Thermodesulfobacteriota bacterium]